MVDEQHSKCRTQHHYFCSQCVHKHIILRWDYMAYSNDSNLWHVLCKGLGGLKLLLDNSSRPLTGSLLYQVILLPGYRADAVLPWGRPEVLRYLILNLFQLRGKLLPLGQDPCPETAVVVHLFIAFNSNYVRRLALWMKEMQPYAFKTNLQN